MRWTSQEVVRDCKIAITARISHVFWCRLTSKLYHTHSLPPTYARCRIAPLTETDPVFKDLVPVPPKENFVRPRLF